MSTVIFSKISHLLAVIVFFGNVFFIGPIIFLDTVAYLDAFHATAAFLDAAIWQSNLAPSSPPSFSWPKSSCHDRPRRTHPRLNRPLRDHICRSRPRRSRPRPSTPVHATPVLASPVLASVIIAVYLITESKSSGLNILEKKMEKRLSNEIQVLLEEKGSVNILTLNRPQQLNALSFQMITELLKCYTAFEEDPRVKLLILKGKGRAFCAGGDVTAVVHSVNEGHWKQGVNFFWNEFRLNYLIATYSIRQVSFLNGIVMGGGAGLSIHGRFRVAMETTVFAMPETALGLFPDIGASYFLSRLPGFFGEFVGLTGARLNGAEMLSCGLATHFVPSSRLTALEESLANVNSCDHFAICAVIDRYSEQVALNEDSAYNRLGIINKCFSKNSVEEILSSLELEIGNGAEKWIQVAIDSLKKASPISLKISLRSIREGRKQSVGQCLIKDYRICCHILRKDLSKDFFEGCRALLVDKDKNPKWEPSRLDLIDDKMVDLYFSKLNDEGWEDLKFPERPNTGVKVGSKL